MNKCGCRRVEGISVPVGRLDVDPINDGTCVCKNPQWSFGPIGSHGCLDDKGHPHAHDRCEKRGTNKGQVACETDERAKDHHQDGLCSWTTNYYDKYCIESKCGDECPQGMDAVVSCRQIKGVAGGGNSQKCCYPKHWPRDDDGQPQFFLPKPPKPSP